MPREDLALTIEWQVIAIFAHQNMRQQARARHSLGDGALRRSSLVDRPAGAATIFGTSDAQNPQPCWHEVKHLTDALADQMERTAAAGTDALFNIERHIFTGQMVGESVLA